MTSASPRMGRHMRLGSRGVDGVDVEIVEMTGEPGDVYLMNLWVLHTRWPNQSREPRIMLTQRFLLQEARDKLGIRVDF